MHILEFKVHFLLFADTVVFIFLVKNSFSDFVELDTKVWVNNLLITLYERIREATRSIFICLLRVATVLIFFCTVSASKVVLLIELNARYCSSKFELIFVKLREYFGDLASNINSLLLTYQEVGSNLL